MARIKIDNFELSYERYGNGVDTIITSMLSTGTQEPSELILLLAKQYCVYDVALRTTGFPPATADGVGNPILTTWAEDIFRLSDALGIGKFIYLGISHGGLVGWNLAYMHPEVLKCFVSIVGAPQDRNFLNTEPVRMMGQPQTSPEAARAFIERMFVPTTDKARLVRRDKLIKHMLSQQSSRTSVNSNTGPGPGLAWPECKTNEEMAANRLSKIEVPILIIHGIQDHFTSPEIPFISAKTVPGIKSVFFQDESHMISGESPQRVIDEINLFITQLNRRD